MVKLAEMPAAAQGFFDEVELSEPEQDTWTEPVPAGERRVAIVSSAGILRRGDKPFSWHARDYRILPKYDRDLVMTHIAVDFDRTAWQQDLNSILPLDRLDEMAQSGEIGSVAEDHYAFLGSTDPVNMASSASEVAARMRDDNVNTVFLVPV